MDLSTGDGNTNLDPPERSPDEVQCAGCSNRSGRRRLKRTCPGKVSPVAVPAGVCFAVCQPVTGAVCRAEERLSAQKLAGAPSPVVEFARRSAGTRRKSSVRQKSRIGAGFDPRGRPLGRLTVIRKVPVRHLRRRAAQTRRSGGFAKPLA